MLRWNVKFRANSAWHSFIVSCFKIILLTLSGEFIRALTDIFMMKKKVVALSSCKEGKEEQLLTFYCKIPLRDESLLLAILIL